MAAAKTLTMDIVAKDKTSRVLGGVMSRLKGLVGVLGGLAAAGGFAALTKNALSSADAIAKTADAIGLTTTALQQYNHAAELSGVSQEALESGLTAFTKRLGEAKAGTGALSTFLGKYDENLLEVVKSSGSTEEALDAMFEALDQAGSQADKAALSAAAFGRTAGVDMVNMVRDGVDSLRSMRDEAATVPESLLRGAETANDAMTRLTNVVSVMFQSLLLALAPIIETVATWLTKAIPEAVRIAENAWAALRGAALWAVEGVVDALESLVSVLAELPEFAGGSMFLEWSEGLQAFSDKIHALRTEIPIYATAQREATVVTQQFAVATTEAAVATDELNKKVKTHEEMLEREAERINQVTLTTYERIVAEQDLVAVLEKQGRISEEVANRRRQQLGEQIQDLRSALIQEEALTEDTADRVATTWETAFDRSGNALADFVERGEFEFENLVAFGLRAAQQLVDAFAGGFGGGGGGGGGFDFSQLLSIGASLFGGFGGGPAGPGPGAGPPLRFQHGGRFTVPGGGGPDSQPVGFMASPGEEVEIHPPGRGGERGPAIGQLTIVAPGADQNTVQDIRRVVREELGPWRAATVRDSVAAVRAGADGGGPLAKALGRRGSQ